MYFLDCPYSDKDEVKSLGAKWNRSERKWYVPTELHDQLPNFNQWKPNGRIFLHVPYAEKDAAKANGARWDATVKLWYCTRLSPKLEQWTTNVSKPEKVSASPAVPSSAARRGNAEEAVGIQISDSMTVSQIQDECRHRGIIKGLSGKSKAWLLDQLGADSPPAKSCIDWSHAPRITSRLTIAQLSHELLKRDPSAKGLSSKPKSWFLSKLGENSVWTTSPNINAVDLFSAPVVTKSLTNVQLMHEIMARTPGTKGLSSKSKDDLITMVGLGSIWTTGYGTTNTVKATRVHSVAASLPSNPSNNQKNQLAPVLQVKSSTTHSAKKTVATKKRAPNDLSVVNASMTIAQLLEEIKYRDPKVTGLSGKNKSWLIAVLGQGTPVLGVKADAEAKALHIHKASFFPHPLADSSILRASRRCGPYDRRKRVDTAQCTVEHPMVCTKKPYRSSEPHDYDICKACFDIESLPAHERSKKFAEIDKRLEEIHSKRQIQLEKERREAAERWEIQQRAEEARWRIQEEEEERARQNDLHRFTANIKKPSEAHTDTRRKKKFTVWTKDTHPKGGFEIPEFDSSFDSVKDANLRVEYLFYYNNPWDEDKENVYTKEDRLVNNQFRYLMTDTDYGETYTVSAMPSADFDVLNSLQNFQGGRPKRSQRFEVEDYLQRDSFPPHVRNPPKQNLSEKSRLRYTVWTSCGYENDGWHSYDGPPDKEFNSSFASLEDANKRAEFVFYFDNPWGLGLDEMSPAETDGTASTGFRFLECHPDDSERWTVSVVPSSAFPFFSAF